MNSFIKENLNSVNYDGNLETDITIHSTYIKSILNALNIFLRFMKIQNIRK